MYHLGDLMYHLFRYMCKILERKFNRARLSRNNVAESMLYHCTTDAELAGKVKNICESAAEGRPIIPPLFPRVSPAPRIDSGKAERLLTVYR